MTTRLLLLISESETAYNHKKDECLKVREGVERLTA
jgi:hypothetical protein